MEHSPSVDVVLGDFSQRWRKTAPVLDAAHSEVVLEASEDVNIDLLAALESPVPVAQIPGAVQVCLTVGGC